MNKFTKEFIRNCVIGVVAVGLAFGLTFSSSEVKGQAERRPSDVESTWRVSKFLAVEVQPEPENLGNELRQLRDFLTTLRTHYDWHPQRRHIAIGPAEWQVSYSQRDEAGQLREVYTETWSISGTPDCLVTPANCMPGGPSHGKFLWGFGGNVETGESRVALPMGLRTAVKDVTDPEFYLNLTRDDFGRTIFTAGRNDDNPVLRGPGAMRVMRHGSSIRQGRNFVAHVAFATGAYGWMTTAYTPYGRVGDVQDDHHMNSEILEYGMLMPLEWRVVGRFTGN